ncbi:MAG TPA: IPT/TIG domain-containing protein, partial [Methylomirabilota bacterium]
FRVIPKITAFDPALGAVGTNVTITGSGFIGVPTVRFGGVAAVPPSSVSLTTLVAAVPAGAVTGSITVTTTEGIGNSSTRFTVVRTPTLTSFTPTSGAAGTSVLLVGTSLTSTSTVTFNGVNASVTSPNASVTTAIRAVVPLGATTGRITITNEAGTVTAASDFHVLPTVTGFTPTAGAAGDTVTITGNALNGATGVRFGTADATILAGGNASQVLAIVPGTATTGPITVTTVEGSDTSDDDFEVLGPMAAASRLRLMTPSR